MTDDGDGGGNSYVDAVWKNELSSRKRKKLRADRFGKTQNKKFNAGGSSEQDAA